MLGHILHLDRVAQVGLVGAIPKRRITIADLRPFMGCINLTTAAEFFKDASDHRADRIEYVLLLDKRHLHVQLIEIGRRTIRPRVFITEARRDLEILVKAGHHDQLLELLRRLRQRIKLARMQA